MSETQLSESFETKYNGLKGSSKDGAKRKVLELIRLELGLEDGFADRGSCKRVYLSSTDLYEIYAAVCDLKDEQPEYLFNGKSLMSRNEFQRLDGDDETDSEKLRDLWKSLGKGRGDSER